MTEKLVNMKDIYEEVNNVTCYLEIDKDDLLIRILYIKGYAKDIKDFLETHCRS